MNKNTGKLYGYIRVSTKEQNEDRQRLAMHELGIADYELYMAGVLTFELVFNLVPQTSGAFEGRRRGAAE